MMNNIYFGIDLGGTKTEIIALNEQGETLYTARTPTPGNSYQEIVNNIQNMVVQAESTLKLTDKQAKVGIGTPGAKSPASGLLRNSNTVCMNDKPLQQDLERALGREICIANDANCFALSEATDGAAAGKNIVFGVIIGTGTGGGVVVNGRVLTGANAIAGEWGHNPLPWPQDDERPGAHCYCGRHGCIETFLSGPGLAKIYNSTNKTALTAIQIAVKADEGEATALACLARYENRLARSLAQIINILDPDTIVLGGGLSNIQRLYREVPKLWGQFIFSDNASTQLVPPKFGDASGVRGAAWLAKP
ncbi:MAG: fructokinase [Alteromonadaceae bacterium]|nr:MAG: fructokinase [Alteromonadaceae bacterium]